MCFLMAATALLTYSCTTSEEENILSTQDYISLNPDMASTYAAMMDLDSLKNDNNGFFVHAEMNDNSTYIYGENHVYDAKNGWSFSTPYPWPATGYPMTFYAYYPAPSVSNLYSLCSECFPAPYVFPMMIPTSKEDQEDLLFARKTANSKPDSGELPLDFIHILSKVNFTVSTTDALGPISDPNHKVYVLAVGFCNLYAGSWFWGDNIEFGPCFTPQDFNYFNSFEPISSGIYEEKDFADATNASFYSSADGQKEHLFLLPQEPDVWDVTSGAGPQPDEAYIKMLYRLENSFYNDSIGYEFASNHPDYEDSDLEAAGYDGPLYLLVGYSFDATWVSGTAYSYNIPLPGGGGGILLDTYFYDNQGNQTDLAFDCNLYDHVFGSSCKLASAVYDWDYKAPKKSFDFVTTRTGR